MVGGGEKGKRHNEKREAANIQGAPKRIKYYKLTFDIKKMEYLKRL
jgi:hypothetical protein